VIGTGQPQVSGITPAPAAAPITGAARQVGGCDRRALLVAVLVLAAGGCATVDPWEDARLESEVKARLVAEKGANLTRLGVASRKAVVYLSGIVRSADEKARAEALARDVKGVRRIVSTVEVHPAAE
jgi:hyperosmotically inducible protein